MPRRGKITVCAILLVVTVFVCIAPSLDLDPTAMRARQKAEQVLSSILTVVLFALVSSMDLMQLAMNNAYRLRKTAPLFLHGKMSLPASTCTFLC
jgi:hypothetical protein